MELHYQNQRAQSNAAPAGSYSIESTGAANTEAWPASTLVQLKESVMQRYWFKKYGWAYIPISITGSLITIAAILLTGATFIEKPINSAFLRNFQLTSFIDLGTAWNKTLNFKDANYTYYNGNDGVTVKIKEGFLGPFVGGYGFGARTTIAGYFLRVDAGWPMIAFFRGSPIWYFGMGVDF